MKINGLEYAINRNTARVSDWDKIYCSILKDILNRGELCENRTGIDTLSIPNVDFQLDLEKSFPILETKKLAIKNTITELLWIYQAKSNEVKWLHDRGNHVWDEWMIDDDGIYRTYDPYSEKDDGNAVPVYDLDGNVIPSMYATSKHPTKKIKSAKYFGLEFAGTIGTCYGGQLKTTDEFDKNVLKKLKDAPNDRRKYVNLLQSQYMRTAVLPTCVWASTYKRYLNKLYLAVDVRSNDMPLGNPFNVTQYAILQSLVAKVSNLGLGTLDWRISDCHIYVNQLSGIEEQLKRFARLGYYEEYIKTHDDIEVEILHDELVRQKKLVADKTIDPRFQQSYAKIVEETTRNLAAFEHLITRENPELFLADKDDFYKFSNERDNPDIKVLKYTSLPTIKMPIAQ